MRTREQYMADLQKMKKNVYLDGVAVGRDDPRVVRASNIVGMTFDWAQDPQYQEMLTTPSEFDGKPVNIFNHVNSSVEDLVKKQASIRKLCNMTGGCIQRCMGADMINGISAAAKDVDAAHGTHYYDNFLKYLKYFQENDLVAAGSQTDPKGDRKARPGAQWDPDQYLHVVERRPDGIVVRGCKVHNTIAPYADELIVVPVRRMDPGEEDYAVSFAIPADTEGVYMICRECFYEEREENLDAPIVNYGDLESMTVFDDVFVPNERIFLNGETEFSDAYAMGFALYHRHSYTGCKPGITDIIAGTTALLADYQGIRKAQHVKEKLADLVSTAELVFATGMASAYTSKKASSGTQVPNTVYCNVARRHAGHNIYHEWNILTDIAGGLAATLPNSKQYNSPEIGKFVKKYIARREGVDPENLWRIFALASDYLCGEYSAVTFQVAGVHGGGSPIMEDIAIMGNYNLQEKIDIAKHLAGIKD